MTLRNDAVDGFYLIHMTGLTGNGVALVVLTDGKIVGSDVVGVTFDGSYAKSPDDDGYTISLSVKAPAGGVLIQGVETGPNGLTYELTAKLPNGFDKVDFVPVSTPLGPVNARFRKLRGMSNA